MSYFARPLATLAPRDLLLLESLPARPTDVALEVGTGSGSSLLRLAGSVAALHGLDVAEGPVERIRRALARRRGPAGDVRLFTLDFCDPAAPALLPTRYDLIFSCDTVEHVPRPAEFFANIRAALAPGGRAFLTFPNEHPGRAHGITFFERQSELRRLLVDAGFAADRVEVHTLTMNRAAERIMSVGWSLPRAAARRLIRPLGRRGAADAPQTFDETMFFATADRLEPLAPLINAYCWAVMWLMGRARPTYRIEPAPESIWDTRILIRASVPGTPDEGDRR